MRLMRRNDGDYNMSHPRLDCHSPPFALLIASMLLVGFAAGCNKEDSVSGAHLPSDASSMFSVHLVFTNPCDGCREFYDETTQLTVYIGPDAIVTLGHVTRIQESSDANGRPAILLTLNDDGTQMMEVATEDHIDERLAMIIDDQIVSLPVVKSTLGRQLIITGVESRFADVPVLVDRLLKGIPES